MSIESPSSPVAAGTSTGPAGEAPASSPVDALVYRRRRTVALPDPGRADLVLIEKLHRPEARLPTHAHSHPSLTWLVAGSVREEVDGRRIDCAPASVLCKPGGARHANRYGGIGARSFVIELPDPDRAPAVARSRLVNETRYFPAGSVVALTAAIYREHTAYDASSSLVIEDLFRQLLGLEDPAPTPGRGTPGWLERVRDRLHDEFHRTLTLADLACDAGVHPDVLSRAFRACFGVRPGGYQRRLRVEWAAGQALHTSRALTEIAHAAGFADQSHFNRTFRRFFGVTPGRFRHSRRRGPERRNGSDPFYSGHDPAP